MKREKDIFDLTWESFANNYRTLVDDVARWYPSGRMEISIIFKDGNVVVYNKSTECLRNIPDEYHDIDDEMEYRKMFNLKVRRYMASANMSQEELSEKTGISQSMLSRYLQCKATPSLFKVKKIARALGCRVSELVDDYELTMDSIYREK